MQENWLDFLLGREKVEDVETAGFFCVGVGMELDFANKEGSSHFKWGGLRSP